ncbi:colorectal mutant cancer protein isoform X2 [Hypomesus transpacificus]|uniref:colorectal mutant cancer protein isoform X2 n=1 Tax=Hypomesus transpacificus TaxID=137520 RepID=UPI001F077B7E|nr:colorectal mutant cancer protein isoform X2 [Hypomesus transpacificus]
MAAAAVEVSVSSGSSDTSSTGEDEKMRRLFQTCDGDGDGYINRNDLLMVCRQLNMEESVAEIMGQLGADERGKISFEDFRRCRMQLVNEIHKEEGELCQDSETRLIRDRIASRPTSSENSLGVRESWEYDSGARDLQSPDIHNQQLRHQSVHLKKRLEQPGTVLEQQAALHKLLAQTSASVAPLGGNYLELANTLHLAALASLKGDVGELNKRLVQTERERDLLEKRLAKAQEHEDLQERTTLRYEERITELHSIIAELNKKIDLLQGTTIREEDEFSELHSELSHSQQDANEDGHSVDQDGASVSLPGNHSTLLTADMDNCSDLNSELQRVLTGLESVLCGRKKSTCCLSVAEVDRQIEQLTTASEHCDLAIKTVEEIEGALGRDYPSLSEERFHWEKELTSLREENESLTAMLCSKEEDLNRTKATMNAIREERDRLRRRVRELQTRLQTSQPGGPSSPGRVTPASRPINPSTGELSTSSSNDIPVAKVAERVKLSKTRSESSSTERPVLGSEISSIGVSSNVAEHLAHSLQDCSNIQEIFQTLYSHGSAISESKIREFEVETERLNSRIEHLKSQNDLLTITLEECKGNAERMSMLVGKYESNATALRLALQYSEQCIEAYELLLALAESEQSLVLGQFKAASVGTVGEQSREESISQILKRAHDSRKTAENTAKDLLIRLDGSCGAAFSVSGCSVQPWESLSSNSHTSTTSSTASSCDTDFSKEDEQRLKDYIQQLKNDRAAVKLTMLELESIHMDTLSLEEKPRGDTHRLDLENAVLMQELMAMKEEMADLKAQLYLLEKEKKAVELRLSTREAQEQAYLVHIEHLKAEVEEQQEQRRHSLKSAVSGNGGSSSKDKAGAMDSGDSPTISLSDLRTLNDSDLAAELTNALRREKKVKGRVQELVAALERLTKSSEVRHQQSAEFVNDLKRANSNLVAAYEKAKKKHQNKLKKMEAQMMAMVERQETQVRMLKQRIALLEEENSRPHTNETSL